MHEHEHRGVVINQRLNETLKSLATFAHSKSRPLVIFGWMSVYFSYNESKKSTQRIIHYINAQKVNTRMPRTIP